MSVVSFIVIAIALGISSMLLMRRCTEAAPVQLSGVYPNDAAISKREMRYGRFINDIDMQEKRKVLVVSEDQAKELLP